jgi:hypothetical protein
MIDGLFVVNMESEFSPLAGFKAALDWVGGSQRIKWG